jgi:hypothetical protein
VPVTGLGSGVIAVAAGVTPVIGSKQ